MNKIRKAIAIFLLAMTVIAYGITTEFDSSASDVIETADGSPGVCVGC